MVSMMKKGKTVVLNPMSKQKSVLKTGDNKIKKKKGVNVGFSIVAEDPIIEEMKHDLVLESD